MAPLSRWQRRSDPPNPERDLRNKVSGEDKRDRAADFQAPFPIYSEEEGQRYIRIRNAQPLHPRYFDFSVLQRLELAEQMRELAGNIGWTRFIRITVPLFPLLILEFFVSLVFNKEHDLFFFRLRGQVYKLDYEVMHRLFNFTNSSTTVDHPRFVEDEYWRALTGESEFNSKNAHNALIESPAHLLLQKFMCHTVFNKTESNKCSTKELFFLWCMDREVQVNTTFHIFKSIVNAYNKQSSLIGMGYMVSVLAHTYEVDVTGLETQVPATFSFRYLQLAEIVDSRSFSLRSYESRTTVKNRRRSAPRAPQDEAGPSRRPTADTAGPSHLQDESDPHASADMQIDPPDSPPSFDQQGGHHWEQLFRHMTQQTTRMNTLLRRQRRIEDRQHAVEEHQRLMAAQQQAMADCQRAMDEQLASLAHAQRLFERDQRRAWALQGVHLPPLPPTPPPSP